MAQSKVLTNVASNFIQATVTESVISNLMTAQLPVTIIDRHQPTQTLIQPMPYNDT